MVFWELKNPTDGKFRPLEDRRNRRGCFGLDNNIVSAADLVGGDDLGGLLFLHADHVFLQLLDRRVDGIRKFFHGFGQCGRFNFAGDRQRAAGRHDIGGGGVGCTARLILASIEFNRGQLTDVSDLKIGDVLLFPEVFPIDINILECVFSHGFPFSIWEMVRPTGVEPVSMASEATILSIELWAHKTSGVYTIRTRRPQYKSLSTDFSVQL